jgi:hypothetical protein
MKGLGVLLMILGLGSCLLTFMNYEFKLLMWIDTWGQSVAWMIRGGVIVLGLLLFMMGGKKEPAQAT